MRSSSGDPRAASFSRTASAPGSAWRAIAARIGPARSSSSATGPLRTRLPRKSRLSRAVTPVNQTKGRPPASSAQSSDSARTFETCPRWTRSRTRNPGGDSSSTGPGSRPIENEESFSRRHPPQHVFERPRNVPEVGTEAAHLPGPVEEGLRVPDPGRPRRSRPDFGGESSGGDRPLGDLRVLNPGRRGDRGEELDEQRVLHGQSADATETGPFSVDSRTTGSMRGVPELDRAGFLVPRLAGGAAHRGQGT